MKEFALEYSCNRSYHWIIIPPDRLFHHILNYFPDNYEKNFVQ